MKKLIGAMIFILCFGISVQAREITAQTNVSPNKIWTVKFTTPYDKNTLDQVKVVDNYGNNIEIEKKIVDDKTITVEPVDGAWGRGVSYQLQTNNVKSATGKALKEPVSMAFETAKTNFVPSGNYQSDEMYLYKFSCLIDWHDGDKAKRLDCDSVEVFNNDTGGITVALNTDMWSTQNLMSSSNAKSVMQQLIENAQSYMKQRYPNRNITVAIFLNELLNYRPSEYSDSDIHYDEKTGKYKLIFLLAAIYPNGSEYILNGGN